MLSPNAITCIHPTGYESPRTAASSFYQRCKDTSLYLYLPLLRICPFASSVHLIPSQFLRVPLFLLPAPVPIITCIKCINSNFHNPDLLHINRGFDPITNKNIKLSMSFGLLQIELLVNLSTVCCKA